MMLEPRAVARALGDARREGRTRRCRYSLHGGRSLTLRDGDGGALFVWCTSRLSQPPKHKRKTVPAQFQFPDIPP